MTVRGRRTVYSDDYYRMKMLITDHAFRARLDWLYAQYRRHQCPVPEGGFGNYESFVGWMNLFWSRWNAVNSSAEMKRGTEAITLGEAVIGSKEMEMLETFRTDILPPVPGEFQDALLREFGFNPKDKKFSKFLEGHIFFGRKTLMETVISIRWVYNKRSCETELLLRIFPHTKQEDILEYWNDIVEEQKVFKDFIGKSKEWTTFDRDVDIYRCWQRAAVGGSRRHGKATWVNSGKLPLDYSVFSELSKKYPDLTLAQIRKSVGRVARLDTKRDG